MCGCGTYCSHVKGDIEPTTQTHLKLMLNSDTCNIHSHSIGKARHMAKPEVSGGGKEAGQGRGREEGIVRSAL